MNEALPTSNLAGSSRISIVGVLPRRLVMRIRVRPIVGLTALVALGWGCSGSGRVEPAGATSGMAEPARARERITIRQFFDLPNHPAYYFPTALTVGPDGALWVADDIDQDISESAIARITTSGQRTNTYYYQNEASPAFEGIAAGSDGALWLTEWGDAQIVRLTTTGQFTTFPLGDEEPLGITNGPDGALWFAADGFHPAIGRITTQGKITNYSKGLSPNVALQDIAVGPDGALWFTESTGDRIGRITTHGKIEEYQKGISPRSKPYSVAPGPDGALWFTEAAGGRIGRITTGGSVTEYSRGITAKERPIGIAAGPDGAMWFTEYQTYGSYQVRDSKIGRITMSGKITEYSHLESKLGPTGIAQGPDGRMWFVETNANRLGRVTL